MAKKKIILIEKDTITTDDETLADTFNTFLSNGLNDKSYTENMLDVNQIIAKFMDHPSVIKIKANGNYRSDFSFILSSLDEMKKCIENLNTKKPSTYNNIPSNILVEFSDICCKPIHKLYNSAILEGKFPDAMKMADITPSHKKDDKCLKENYRPISILSSSNA